VQLHEINSPKSLRVDACLTSADLLFAQIGALTYAELRKLLLRDLVERGVEALRDQP
jgi:hypothetical protein